MAIVAKQKRYDKKSKKKPGDNLLSHGETPHYHRRAFLSLLSSRWIQVGRNGYRRQAKLFFMVKCAKNILKSFNLYGQVNQPISTG